MSGGGAEREGAHNLKQALGSELSAQSQTRGSNSWSARSWPEPKSDAQPTEPLGRPYKYFNILLNTFPKAFLCLVLLKIEVTVTMSLIEPPPHCPSAHNRRITHIE